MIAPATGRASGGQQIQHGDGDETAEDEPRHGVFELVAAEVSPDLLRHEHGEVKALTEQGKDAKPEEPLLRSLAPGEIAGSLRFVEVLLH